MPDRTTAFPLLVVVLMGAAILAPPASAQEAPAAVPAADAHGRAIVAAADGVFAMLTPDRRDAATFDRSDRAQRARWSNFSLGGPGANRQGVKRGDLSDDQRAAPRALPGTVPSRDGLRLAMEQVAADDIVAAQDAGEDGPPGAPVAEDGADEAPDAQSDAAPADQGQPPDGARPPVSFGSACYFVSFVGAPSATYPWMLQFGGHHLALNATVVGPHVTLARSLTGGQPTRFTLDGRQVYIVEREVAEADAPLASLTEAPRATAVISDSRIDLVLGPGRDGPVRQPDGLAARDMTEAQRAGLLALIEARLDILDTDDLAATLAPIAASLGDTTFGWRGPADDPAAAYWRVGGTAALPEVSPQGMDGDPADHPRNIARDPTNDDGAAWAPLP